MELPKPMYLTVSGGRICYRKSGTGPRLILAFHGFGADGSVFRSLAEDLALSCTIYAIDLPFHGGTGWQSRDYRPWQLVEVVEGILRLEGSTTFEALGHSLGARLWMVLLPHFGTRIEGLYLLSPDGLRTRWMVMAEFIPGFLRPIVGQLLQRPAGLLWLAGRLQRMGVINPFLLRFLKKNLTTGEENRRRLLNSWYALRHFPLGLRRARRRLRNYGGPCLVVLGDNDRLIRAQALLPGLSLLPNVRVEVVAATHRSLCEAAAPLLALPLRDGTKEQS